MAFYTAYPCNWAATLILHLSLYPRNAFALTYEERRGEKKQKASLLHCSLLFSFSGKVPLHSISKYCCQYCNCRIQHFSKNVTEKGKIQTAYERTAACRWSKSYTQGSHKQFWVPLLYFCARDCSHIRNSNRWKLGQLQGEEENASGKSTLAHSSRPQLRQGEFQGDGVVTG